MLISIYRPLICLLDRALAINRHGSIELFIQKIVVGALSFVNKALLSVLISRSLTFDSFCFKTFHCITFHGQYAVFAFFDHTCCDSSSSV